MLPELLLDLIRQGAVRDFQDNRYSLSPNGVRAGVHYFSLASEIDVLIAQISQVRVGMRDLGGGARVEREPMIEWK